jgi:hypothetical protein
MAGKRSPEVLAEIIQIRETHRLELAAMDSRLREERDRRYAEVALEREKALKIKEEADKAALALQRLDQTYKDEQGNKLREQINSERNTYVTTDQLAAAVREMTSKIQPLNDYVSGQQGKGQGGDRIVQILGLLLLAVSVAFGVYAGTH